ncbi:Uncharacterised protein [Mycobacterium tuberculosis]|nr:Uncharacterised protein [Mycobacterium tuberculosis]
MPSGNTSGSKLMSRALPGPSVCTAEIVIVPASTVRRDVGQGLVASWVGSPGSPMVMTSRQLTGRCATVRISSSNR